MITFRNFINFSSNFYLGERFKVEFFETFIRWHTKKKNRKWIKSGVLLNFSLWFWFCCVQCARASIHRVAVKAVCRSNKNHQFMTSAYIPKSPGLDLFETVISFLENICVFLRIRLEMNKIGVEEGKGGRLDVENW